MKGYKLAIICTKTFWTQTNLALLTDLSQKDFPNYLLLKKVKKDKNFIYKTCPHCNNELKISKTKKGNRLIMCTKCYNEINVKV